MAKPPLPPEELLARYGPHLSYTPPGGWDAQRERPPDRLVKTHCCFCGQQCGIQLKVRDNQVVGFEPWEEFPFNQGMLCPKGVKRYLQSGHPDRLLDPLLRTDSGFRAATWDESLDFTVRRLREIQERYGKDAIAVYGGASLTTEKSYLLGKFARVALGTRHIDYNGRLCMVSAGTAYKMAFGVDRSPNPWSDIPQAQVVFVIGANIAECAPITTQYVWRCRDAGGRLIAADPRMTPITRNADLYLPLRPGTDLALLMGLLHVILRDGLADREFVDAHTTGFEEVAESVKAWDPQTVARRTGVPPESIEKAARWIGEAERAVILHARGLEHQSKGVENCLAVINLALATGNIGREGAGCMMVTGQGNGQGGREHGQKCDQLPGQRSIADPAARQHVARVWGIAPEEIPQAGLTAVEIMEAIHRGEIKGLLSICFNPLVSLPDANYTREALEKLEFFGVVDFFLSETAQLADVVLAGSLQEEEEGVVGSAEGRVIHIQKAVDPPGNAWPDSRIYVELAKRLGKEKYFPYASPRDIFAELREASRGGPADYAGITYEKIDRQLGVFWPCPSEEHPGTPRLFEGGRFFHPDGKARFVVTEWRESGDPVAEDFPLYLTTGRVVSQYLSGTQTRRIGALVDQFPWPRLEIHPRLAETHGIADGDWVTITTRRDAITLEAMVVRTIRPDTVFIAYHWPGGAECQSFDASHARSAQQDPGVQGLGLPHRQSGPDAGLGAHRAACGPAAAGRGPPGGGVGTMFGYEFFIDPERCIGCQACVNACAECDTHKGVPMITVDYLDRRHSIATVPAICMHCDDPTCAEVCPADAIKKGEDGVVQSALKPRCIACSNCVLACPFGIPKMMSQLELMMKCDMCYDRTSAGKRPMCATVCPSQALAYVPPERIARERREKPVNVFQFGNQTVTTKVYMMLPPEETALAVDVVDFMWEPKEVAL